MLTSAFAQNMLNSSLNFQGQNNTFFTVGIDGIRIVGQPRNSAEMPSIVPGVHLFIFQIVQPNGSFFNYRTSIFVESGFAYTYTIEFNTWTGLSFLQTQRTAIQGNINNNPYNNSNNNPYNNSNNNPYNNSYNYSNADCMRMSMSDEDFSTYLNTIQSKMGDHTKLSIADQGLRRRQIRCSQVLQVMKLFSFESSRLEFAKFAYDYLCDAQNVYLLNDGFTFSSSTTDFDAFLKTKR